SISAPSDLQRINRKNRSTPLVPRSLARRWQFAANDLARDLFLRGCGERAGGDEPSSAHDAYPVRAFHHFVKLVRDEYDCLAFCAETPEHREQAILFLRREDRSRLV